MGSRVKKKYFFQYFFCIYFLDVQLIALQSGANPRRTAFIQGGRVQKKVTENFGWKNRVRRHLRYYHSLKSGATAIPEERMKIILKMQGLAERVERKDSMSQLNNTKIISLEVQQLSNYQNLGVFGVRSHCRLP